MSAWPEPALGELIAEASPGFACGEDVDEGVFQFRMNNITAEGHLDLTKRRRVPKDYRNIDRFLVQPGDVLFNATNSPALVGKTAFFGGIDEPAVFSNHFLRLRSRNGAIDGRYLSRWLNLQFQRGLFKSMCRQWVNQATVGRVALLSMRVPLPPLPEQRRIAEILDKADALRAKRRAALAKLDTLTQSIFLDMFGDPVTNPKGWNMSNIDDVSDKVTDGEHLTPRRELSGIKLLSARNVRDGRLDMSDVDHIGQDEYDRIARRCDPKRGDILISCSGTIGRVAPVETDEPFALVRSAAMVRPKQSRVRTKFLEIYLRTSAMQSHMLRRANASSQANLFQGQIRSLPVLTPPLSLQDQFEKEVTGVTTLHKRLSASLEGMACLFASLQHRAFRGEL